MTVKLPADKPVSPRHPFGPRPIGALLPALTRPAFKSKSPAAAQLMADWPTIVGPALASTTQPLRFASGTLTLGCTGPVALELQHLAGTLIERINSHLGRALVERLRFVQTAMVSAAAPAKRPSTTTSTVEIEGLPDGPLRDALAALGGALRAERA